jgi:Tfp pilus assembly protein PilN
MTATMLPPQTSPETGREPARRLTISVNLLPEEVRTARANRAARRAIAGVLVAAAAATGGWYYHARQATADASSQVAQAQQESAAAVRGQRAFGPLKATRAQIDQKKSSLAQTTKGDVAWSRLIPAIRGVMPRGITLTGITGTAAVSTQTNAAATPGAAPVTDISGSILLSGAADSKDLISAFSNRLATVPGLGNVQITSVQADSQTKQLTFSIQAATTAKALNTRHAKAVK